ncbi:MAG: response regulator transcription factor [Micrococcales bacterium]|nr:response regulator transcription factor [Micrococcales bacterium]
MSAGPATVMIVDDHALFRDGLSALVSRWPDFEVVGCAGNGNQAVDMARVLRPDLALMDVRQQGMSRIDTVRTIAQSLPATRIVVLTTSNLGDDVIQALRNGAHGYLSKAEPADQLRSSLASVLKGEMVLSTTVAAKVLGELAAGQSRSGAASGQSLTSRERDVLRGVIDGLSNEEIAERLHLSEATIKKHIGRVMAKWQLKNRVQVAVRGVRSGILS